MKKRPRDLLAHVGRFVRMYGRKRVRGHDPNDRQYDRRTEQLVQRMGPAELDRLLNGDGEPGDGEELRR